VRSRVSERVKGRVRVLLGAHTRLGHRRGRWCRRQGGHHHLVRVGVKVRGRAKIRFRVRRRVRFGIRPHHLLVTVRARARARARARVSASS
jgi:hypothetical protein